MALPVPVSPFLRRVLLADAVLSAATGVLLTFASGTLSRLLGLPAPLLVVAGLVCLGFAALVGWLGRSSAAPRGLLWVVVAGNALWAIDSVLLLATGWVDPTLLGIAIVLFQAAVVAVLAELQFVGLRRAAAA